MILKGTALLAKGNVMTTARTSSLASPFVLGLVGLALMVGGWKASTYVPEGPRQADNARKADELRRMTDDSDLRQKIDTYARRAHQPPPYEMPGRLAFFAGLGLFIMAGVRMYRQPPPAEEKSEEEPEGAPAATPKSP
jgi:hypothetical protein